MLSQLAKLPSSLLTSLICCIALVSPLCAQHFQLGTPVVSNFTKTDYRGGTQNWDGFVSDKGLLYFANNNGMMEFDGAQWRMFPLPKGTVVRSLYYMDSATICVGGQGEVGYFRPDGIGNWEYNSLADRVPSPSEFDDIWELFVEDGQMIFRANGKIYAIPVLDEGKPGWVWGSDAQVTHLSLVEDRLYLHQMGVGVQIFDPESRTARPLAESPVLADLEVTSILPHPEGVLISTIRSGLFLHRSDGSTEIFAPELRTFLTENRIYSAIQKRDGGYALATSTGGLLLINGRGDLVEVYDRRNGLQFNNALCVFEDLSGNLWIGLDNGIDMVAAGSSYRRFFPDGELQGTAYAMAEYQGSLYCGTNNGLYVLDTAQTDSDSNPVFELVPGTRGQVWHLQVIRDQLLMGHHEGTFQIIGNRAVQISETAGAWRFQEISSEDGKHRMICGHYEGLELYEWNNGWRPVSQFDEFNISSRFLALDHYGYLWVAHPYKGLWRMRFNNDKLVELEMIGDQNGLPTTFGLKVFPLGDDLIVTADKHGAWQLDAKGIHFEKHSQINDLLGSAPILAVLEGEHGDIWCISNPQVYRLRVVDQGLTKQVVVEELHELQDAFVGGFESLFELNRNNAFIATDRGFLHLKSQTKKKGPLQPASIRSISCADMSDSLLFAGAGQPPSNTSMPARFRSWYFEFSAPSYEAPERLQYSWKLEGFEESRWSDWSDSRAKEYTNLDAGNYRFMVKARDLSGTEYSAATFDFTIRRFWYSTPAAYIFYMLILSAILSSLIVAPRRKFARESARLAVEQQRNLAEQEARHQETVETSNREINALRAEKLQTEVDSQNKQLAMTTMHLVQKNALITKVMEELARMESTKDINDSKKMARQLINMFESDNRLDEEWEQFELHFDKVHANFLARLRTNFPQLTPKDRKLCAFLRLNLSTKEIAPMLNISIRGVEISRYRLRKKLGIDREVNLVEYLMGI